jgi:hypothetical protein
MLIDAMYDLKLSRQHELIKSSRAISRVNKLKLVALMMGTETVPETSASFSLLTRLIAQEDFIN